ncbi:MAG TPA: ABC transporter permease, partial [Catenuloplanes sp.]
MTTLVLVRRFLTDYVRNPVNLLLLAVVPTVFVVVVAGSLADSAELLGGPGGPAVQTATAGWAAAFLAGIAMYFQSAATRDTDRRLVIAGIPAARLALARLLTGGCLALMAATTAVIALAVRTGIDAPARVVAGTLMFAVIYVAIGAAVGSVVANPVNGTVIVLFVWILDVFFGPAMGAADRAATHALPTHYVTLWMVDLPSGHSGRGGDLGWALAWTGTAAVAAWALAAARTRTAHRHAPRARPGSILGQTFAAVRAAWRDARRNPAMWVLFIVVPTVFILAADAITPDKPITVLIDEDGRRLARTFAMPDVHDATMAPIAIASLAALVGLFTVLDSRDGDRRTALAGLRPGALLCARLGVLALSALTATAVSLATTALVFHPVRWPTYAAANILIALTYGLVGALLAPVFGRVGGVFIAFLLPFLDLGIVQSPMLHPEPTTL